MDKFHINGRGVAGKCSAVKGSCPFGDDSDHYTTEIAARAAYEKSMESGRPLRKAPKELVRRNSSGELIFANADVKAEYAVKELRDRGFTVKISKEQLKKKYYISRSATVVFKQVEKALASEAQLRNYMKSWNRYDHMYDSIQVLDRDELAKAAAEKEFPKITTEETVK